MQVPIKGYGGAPRRFTFKAGKKAIEGLREAGKLHVIFVLINYQFKKG